MDKYYERQKKANLIYTEAHYRRNGSNLSMEPDTPQARPFIRLTGVSQWSREKRRYLTFEEWEKVQQYWECHQNMIMAGGRHPYEKSFKET